MISVAADVWLAFFCRRPEVAALEELLLENIVAVHRYVAAELALRLNDARRVQLLEDVGRFVTTNPLSHSETWDFVRHHRLEGAGVGYVDTHALASASAEGNLFWSMDPKVQLVSERLQVAFRPGYGR